MIINRRSYLRLLIVIKKSLVFSDRSQSTVNAINQAINDFHSKTCIRFVPRASQTNSVIFYGRYYSGYVSYLRILQLNPYLGASIDYDILLYLA